MDEINIIRFIAAFVFVIGLVAGFGYLLKRFGHAQKWMGAGDHGGRLGVVEVRYLDPKRRLVLIKRDNTEHLILLSEGRELLIERGITPNA